MLMNIEVLYLNKISLLVSNKLQQDVVYLLNKCSIKRSGTVFILK